MIRRLMVSALVALSLAASAKAVDFDNYRALALTPGTWTYRQLPDGSEARFGQALVLRCHRPTRSVSIARVGFVPGTANTTILTSSGQRTIAAGTSIAANDPILDSVAFSRGRIIVSVGSLLPLVAVPNWPEAARSIEDCRI